MQSRTILQKTWHFLARLQMAAILILILLLLTMLGSCFPQLSPSFSANTEGLAQWEAGLRDRYRGLTDTLTTLKVFQWFHSPVFLFSLTLLVVATLVCTLDRWRTRWRRTFDQPIRCPDGTFASGPHTFQMHVPPSLAHPGPVRESLRQRGFRVRSETVGNIIYVRGDRYRLTPLATLVTHLATLLLLLGVTISSGYSWQETLIVGPAETINIENNDSLAIHNDGFAMIRSPDGNVANYEAKVTILNRVQTVAQRRIRVNEPLHYEGIDVYLRGYGGINGAESISLLAVYDPGYGLVIVGGFLLVLGMTVSFNFPHSWLYARLDPDGTLRLAGWAERRVWDFGREFSELLEELQHLVRVEDPQHRVEGPYVD